MFCQVSNRAEPRETANIPRTARRNRIDRNQNVNFPQRFEKQPQPSADKSMRLTAENRGLNRKCGKSI